MSDLSTVQEVLLIALEGTIERLDRAVGDLTFDQLDLSADKEAYPGTWTIREIIHHLADDGDNWSMLIKRAIATPEVRATLEGYPGNEAWAGLLDFEDRDCRPALGLIRAHNVYLRELLARFHNAWERRIVLVDVQSGTERPMSVLQIVEMLVAHMEEHLEQIEAIRAYNGI